MSIKKSDRPIVYQKYGGRCAYCGNEIKSIKDMQVDHIITKRNWIDELEKGKQVDHIDNYNPACRRCNHYKRANSLELFRQLLKTIELRLRKDYLFKVAEDYGVVQVKPFDGVFYFEKNSIAVDDD